ncbi:MAG: hypothetical protein QOG04_1588 [Actinomycetota bacterium]|jgi:hypothetical protein|nr:hypothetical protein [Actinomycetota bacterium]
MTKTFRTLATVAVASLLLGALVAAPAEARKKKPKPKPPSCPAATYADPASPSASRPEPGAATTTITDAATAEAPVTIEFEHGPALWETASQTPIQEDTKWFPIQVDSASSTKGIYLRLDWAVPSVSDMDLYLWDGGSGEQAAVSGATNAVPVNAPFVAETGAMGYESISGFAVSDCATFLVESRAFMTAGEAVTLTMWLGDPAA